MSDSGTKVIDDLIVLGRSGPELISDGRHTVCLGGYSPEEGYIRIYPTHMYSDASRWNVIGVPVEDGDFRDESYKIEGSKSDWDNLYKKIQKHQELSRNERLELIENLPKTCPAKLNEKERSLGLVEPAEIHDAYLDPIENPEPVQQDIKGNELRSKNSYSHKLYIEYTCEGCKQSQGYHRHHVMEWGVYQWWNRNPDDPEQVIENLRINDDDWKKYFFIGNLRQNPKSFVIISVLRFKKSKQEIAKEAHKQLEQF